MDQRTSSCRLFAGLFAAGLCFGSSGCYSYTFQERTGGDLARVPIDRNLPTKSVRWSMWWGLRQDTWAPTECSERDAEGGCVSQIELCEYGAGQVTSHLVWYSAPTMILSLGIAMPLQLTAYCATTPVGGESDSGGPPPSGP